MTTQATQANRAPRRIAFTLAALEGYAGAITRAWVALSPDSPQGLTLHYRDATRDATNPVPDGEPDLRCILWPSLAKEPASYTRDLRLPLYQRDDMVPHVRRAILERLKYLPILPIFTPGKFSATPDALAMMHGDETGLFPFLDRHLVCDWGDLDDEDLQANWDALLTGERLLSHYIVKPGAGPLDDNARLYIITEADRARTLCLLPEEY